jgi:hypothetical protein
VSEREVTVTGGREATSRRILGQFSLAVGKPELAAPIGWEWVKLADVARLESGHTPSRRHPEYWGGDIPWLGIRDAKAHHGETINSTNETINELGIENSSARVLPAGTVCLSRTASVGYVVMMGRPMATSQDFANWVCSEKLIPRFLVYLFLAEQSSLLRFSSGAVHQTIYYPELKAFHICLPVTAEQQRIVRVLDATFDQVSAAVANSEKKLLDLTELRHSILTRAMAGRLKLGEFPDIAAKGLRIIHGISPTDLHAGILALAYQRHEQDDQQNTFGHVKAEKIAHMIEAFAGIDLQRDPIKDAAGPNDYPHLKKVEHRARMANYFTFKQISGGGYRLEKRSGFDALVQRTRAALGVHGDRVDQIIDLMRLMDTQQAEIFTTVYAAWNNLLIDGKQANDEAIVTEARENWHVDKLEISRDRFFSAISWMKDKGVVPSGLGKRVMAADDA